jgi:RecG-like helicase
MTQLTERFSKPQTDKLAKIGIVTLYDFITFLPRGLKLIRPLYQTDHQFNSGDFLSTAYIWQATLQNFQIGSHHKRFLSLTFQDQFRQITCYYFAVHPGLSRQFKPGQTYQLLLRESNGLLVLEKFSPVKEAKTKTGFCLGQADPNRSYFVPIYPVIKGMTQTTILQMHQKLNQKDYTLDLNGLIPTPLLSSLLLNLQPLHHPTSLEKYQKTRADWSLVQAFLQFCLVQFVNSGPQKQARKAELDLTFLRKLSTYLDFQLSLPQKQVIWEILQEIC